MNDVYLAASLLFTKQKTPECPAFLVDEWGDNVYIQFSESPRDFTQDQIKALHNYFSPILFIDADQFYWSPDM